MFVLDTSGAMFQVKVSFLSIRLNISTFSESFFCYFSLDLCIFSSFVPPIGIEKIICSSSVFLFCVCSLLLSSGNEIDANMLNVCTFC